MGTAWETAWDNRLQQISVLGRVFVEVAGLPLIGKDAAGKCMPERSFKRSSGFQNNDVASFHSRKKVTQRLHDYLLKMCSRLRFL